MWRLHHSHQNDSLAISIRISQVIPSACPAKTQCFYIVNDTGSFVTLSSGKSLARLVIHLTVTVSTGCRSVEPTSSGNSSGNTNGGAGVGIKPMAVSSITSLGYAHHDLVWIDDLWPGWYKILALIRKGTVGQISQALDQVTSEEVAIKVIKKKRLFLQRAESEIKLYRKMVMFHVSDQMIAEVRPNYIVNPFQPSWPPVSGIWSALL